MMTPPPPDLASVLYRWACRAHGSRSRVVRRLGGVVWGIVEARATGSVVADMYGTRLRVPVGDRRPVWAAEIPTLGTPIVAAVHLARSRRGGPVVVVDVGAAVGDTAALVLGACPDDVGRIVCIEGHPDFFALLVRNLDEHLRAPARGVALDAVHALLADEEVEVPALTTGAHAGTATVGSGGVAPGAGGTGGGEVPTVTAVRLDDTVPVGATVDVVKVDTDGFDGRVLAGAPRTLRQGPVVVFEWSPIQYADVGADVHQPFEVLAAAGYERFLLYSKEGRYLEDLVVGDVARGAGTRLADLAAAFEATRGGSEEYVDVLALPPDGVAPE